MQPEIKTSKTQYAFFAVAHFFCALFLFMVMFLGFARHTQAACSYTITRFDSQGSILRTGTLNYNVTVKRVGTSAECANNIDLIVYAKASYDYYPPDGMSPPVHYDSLELTRKSASFNSTDQASLGFTYNLGNLTTADWQKIPNQNLLETYLVVRASNTKVAESSIWSVNVAGASGASPGAGLRNITLSFDRATYNKDDYVNVVIRLDNPSGAPNVEIVTYVNGKEVGVMSKSGSEVASSQIQRVTVSSNNGFKDGSNGIEVKMFQQGTNRSIEFAHGTAQVQATGFGSSGSNAGGETGSPGANAGGGAGSPGANAGGTYNTNFSDTDRLYNPLPTGNLINMILIIAKGFLTVTAVIAVAFIMIGGFQMIISRGNEEAQTKAKKTITWAIIGVVIASLSFSIIAIVENLLRAGVKIVE